MEYSEIPTSFNLDSKAGQTFRCAASYSASLPAFIRNRNATLGNWTSRLSRARRTGWRMVHDRDDARQKAWVKGKTERRRKNRGSPTCPKLLWWKRGVEIPL